METRTFSTRQQMADGDRPGARLGKGLGLFSIGLGLTELIAPRALARFIGIDDCGRRVSLVTRLFGARELAAGALLLAKPTSPYGGFNRAFGDLIDLVAMGIAMRRGSTSRGRNMFALGNVLAVTALDVFHGVREMRRNLGEPVRRAVTIALPRSEVYAMWKNFERLPEFMNWVESVDVLGGGITHWKVRTPVGKTIEYNAETIEDIPGRRISWRTTPDATVPNRGTVEFLDAPGGRGTEVLVEMQVAAPLGKTIASQEAASDLRRLKQILELGEIIQSDASIHTMPHAAQPAEGGLR
jgi:uncharacterized membrane protein